MSAKSTRFPTRKYIDKLAEDIESRAAQYKDELLYTAADVLRQVGEKKHQDRMKALVVFGSIAFIAVALWWGLS